MFKNKAKSLIILSFINALSACISYILTLYLIRYFGPSLYGTYSHVLLLSTFMMIFSIYGTEQTAASIYTNHSSLNNVFNLIHFFRIFITIFAIIFLFFYLIFTKQQSLFFYTLCLLALNFNLSYIYELSQRNERYSYIALFEKLIYISIMFILIFTKLLTLTQVFISIFVISISSICFQLYDNFYLINPIKAINFSNFKSIFYLNTPLVIVSISLFVYGGISRLYLESSLGTEVLGKYSAGWQLITLSNLFQTQVSKIWRPEVTKAVSINDNKALLSQLKSYFFLSILPNILGGGILIIFANQIILFLFGAKYLDIASSFSYFGLYFLVISLFTIIDMLWVALHKTFVYMLIQLFYAIGVLFYFYVNHKNMTMLDFAKVTVLSHFILCLILTILWYFIYKKNSIINIK